MNTLRPLLLLRFAALIVSARAASAATFTIADGDVANLKLAITMASNNGQDNTINLAANGTYTLTAVDNSNKNTYQDNGLPPAGTSGHVLTINGNGATLQRSTDSGTPDFRLLEVDYSSNINSLTFVNGGGPGGGVYNGSGTLNLQGCVFNGNASYTYPDPLVGGGAIFNSAGTVIATNCQFTSNRAIAEEAKIASGGGAIFNQGPLVSVVNCTFANNVCQSAQFSGACGGGAIYNEAPTGSNTNGVTVNGCTFTGNTASFRGGAIENDGYLVVTASLFDGNSLSQTGTDPETGGAIYNSSTASVQNCTFHGNLASAAGETGGAIESEANSANSLLTVLGCTFLDNSAPYGSAIHVHAPSSSTAVLHLGDTIVGYESQGDSISSSGLVSLASLGYNLSVDGTGGFLTGTADQTLVDPKLDPAGLQNNGGPTKTYGLTAGSPAINRGRALGLTTDQRGQARPYALAGYANAPGGDGSDIGAYEAADTTQTGSTLIVNSLADHDDGICGDTDATLREAVNRAVAIGQPMIAFSPGLTGTLTLALGEIDVAGAVNLTGPGARNLSISGNNASRIFNLSGIENSSTLSGLTIRNATFTGAPGSSGLGGAITSQQSLTINACEFVNNSCTGGRGLYAGLSGFTGAGGAIYSDYFLTLNNCTFSGNTITGGAGVAGTGRSYGGSGGAGQGAAVYCDGLGGVITNCTFYANNAYGGAGANGAKGGDGGQGAGGAVANYGTTTMLACTVGDNSANGGAPGTGSTSGNGAWGATNGGGLYNIQKTFKVTDTIVGDDTKNSSAGGLDVDGAFTSGGCNLIGVADGGMGFTATGDLAGTNASPIDPGLYGPVTNTGGPTDTLTFVSGGSPAIDASNNAVAPHRDQRGYLRTGRSDIGAYESNGSLINLVSFSRSGADLVIQAEVVQGKVYGLQRKLNLTDSQWQTVLPYKTASGNDIESFTDFGVLSSYSGAFDEVTFLH